jgi:hypothetical protein
VTLIPFQVVFGVIGVLSITWWLYRRSKVEVKEMLDDYKSLMESPGDDGVADSRLPGTSGGDHEHPAVRVVDVSAPALSATTFSIQS